MKTRFPYKDLIFSIIFFSIAEIFIILNKDYKYFATIVLYVGLYLGYLQYAIKVFEYKDDKFIIHYVLRFFCNKKVYPLHNIEKLEFEYPQAPTRIPWLWVNIKGSAKSIKYQFETDEKSLNKLVELLKKKGLTIEYISKW